MTDYITIEVDKPSNFIIGVVDHSGTITYANNGDDVRFARNDDTRVARNDDVRIARNTSAVYAYELTVEKPGSMIQGNANHEA